MRNKCFLAIAIFFFLFNFSARAQEITMFTGFWDNQFYQDNERISKKDLKLLLEKDDVAIKHWNNAKTYKTLSWVALAAEAGFGVWSISDSYNQRQNIVPTIGVLGSFAGVITFSLISHHQKKKAILKYNEGLDNKISFKIMPSKQGIGIVMEF
ncbi:hypothetical protein UMM65_15695 [Aureibaculum sp. 2210JD6-5]|uniref:hypothetical protein n=1 Tax=Aureibaculum sp. 2210JD6-5 TaxID=3103957 RepID=UPI002AAD9CA1|nr:hypothetical protein [Aureibaculum sp. 2210JD6-5]MDY7396692.1 hypothetical protein [Aureibaculum sp. 2210JD6-5]